MTSKEPIFLDENNFLRPEPKPDVEPVSEPAFNNQSYNDYKFNIKQFDPLAWLPEDGFTAIFYGQRRSGKTIIATEWLSILSKKRKWKHAYLFCETANAQLDVYEFIPKCNKYDTLDESVLQNIFDEQEEMKQKFDKGLIKKLEPVLIVGDDLMGTGKKLRHTPILDKVFSQGRHYMIDFCLLLQASKGCGPTARKNADAIVSFRAMAYPDRKAIVDDYLSLENSRVDNNKGFAVQEHIWSKANFTTICIDRAHSANCKSIEEFVYYYRAQEKSSKFYIGTDDEWKNETKEEENNYCNENVNFRRCKKPDEESSIFKNNANEDECDVRGYDVRIRYVPKTGNFIPYKSKAKTKLLVTNDVSLEKDNELVPKTIRRGT